MKRTFTTVVIFVLIFGSIAGASPRVVSIGTGVTGWEYPFNAVSDCRLQSVYRASEIGTSGSLRGLMLDMQSSPGGQTIHNFTIRVKHTSLEALTVLDADGWSIVYRGDVPSGPSGWRIFKFLTLYDYNGVDNLMIDFSYNDESGLSSVLCSYTTVSGKRSACASSNNAYDDPMYWKGTLSPTVHFFTRVPNIKLFFESAPDSIISFGRGTELFDYPLHSVSQYARTQSIYYADEIKKAGTIKGITLDINTPAGIVLNDFTVRMKHTILQQSNVFDVNGWTVVYSANLPILSKGVQYIMFSSPFEYNGNDNLMVDFSFNNSISASSGLCYSTIVDSNRTVCASSDNPTNMSIFKKIPNLKFCFDSIDTSLGIMSYNIKFDDHELPLEDRWTSSLEYDRADRAIAMINSQSLSYGQKGPDIIGLQEAKYNQICDVMKGSERYNYYGVGRSDGVNGDEQCSILYRRDRFIRTDQGTFWLSETPDMAGSYFTGDDLPRIASWVKLYDKLTHRTYFVLNAHLSASNADARNYGASLIRTRIKTLSSGLPIIVMGDWNSHEIHNPYKTIIGINDPTGFQLVDSYRQKYPTMGTNELSSHNWTGATGGTRIDFITHSPWFSDKRVILERGKIYGRYPSDHYPLTALIQPVDTMPADLNHNDKIDLYDLDLMVSDWLDTTYTLTNSTVDNGLLAFYRFNETSGSTVTDAGPNNNDGIITGECYRRSNGMVEGSVEFPALDSDYGYDSGYINVNHNISGGSQYQQTLNQFSICVWVKLNKKPEELKTILGNKAFGSSYPGSVVLGVDSSSKIRVDIAVNNPSYFLSNAAIDIDKWYCLLVMYDKDQKIAKLYINGELDSTVNFTTAVTSWLGPLEIGAYQNNNRCWDGYIDELRIYNRLLTDDEIGYLAAGGYTAGTIEVPLATQADVCNDISNSVNIRDFAEFAESWFDSITTSQQ
jgi:endonuclease/exonuclease/phosphatase family metal-dependent hydrolase